MVNLFNEVLFGVYFEGGYRICCIRSLLNCFLKCAQQGEALYTPYVIFVCEMIDNIVGKLQLVTFHHNNVTSLGQGNILHKHVILSMGRGRGGGGRGVGFPACITIHRTGGICLGGGICLQEGGLHPGGDWADHTPRYTWDTTGYGKQAGGTHPTGMHSFVM